VDKTRKLREITLLFFRESIGSLALMQKDMDAYPHDEEARRRWVEEIRQLALRAEGLHNRWAQESLTPERPAEDVPEPEPRPMLDTPPPG
jgi:hypothetical protein